jgi:hypothetical protein
MIVGTSRVVDRTTSLSLGAISNVKEKLKRTDFVDSAKSLATLKLTLEDLFEKKKASALDQDRDGNTVLSVSRPILIFRSDCSPLLGTTFPLHKRGIS